MIGSLRGVLLERGLTGELIVEVQGVGYRVNASPGTATSIGAVGDEVFVHVHHHIREDAQTLYGFATREERLTFEALISAHGVGPSLALAILSVHPPLQLRAALAADDVDALCKVPGVGKKTATRLLVELKSKLDLPLVDLAALPSSGVVGNGLEVKGAHADVRDALMGLGCAPDEIRRALADLPEEGDPAVLVKRALQLISVRA